MIIMEAAIYYRVGPLALGKAAGSRRTPAVTVYPYIGGRYTDLDVKLDITRYRHISGTTTYSSFEDGKDWVDPIIGARTVWTFPGGKRSMHKGFEDPAAFTGREDEKITIFRRVRDEIGDWIVESFGGEGERGRLK